MGGHPRRTATVLVTDMVASTEARARLGDDHADNVRRRHDELIRSAVSAHGGQEVKGLGDGFLVLFEAAGDALDAAVAVQRAIDHHGGRAGHALSVRVGVSAGDVALEDGDVFGTPVVEAARLCTYAAGGQILCSALVQALAGSRTSQRLQPVGEITLKGLAHPVPAFEVSWEAASAPETVLPAVLAGAVQLPFVGRQREQASLSDVWSAAREGALRVAFVSGEPGVGKTRLVSEFARRLSRDGAVVLAGRCDEAGDVPYQPFVEALRHWVAHADAVEVRRALANRRSVLGRLLPELLDGLDPGAGGPDVPGLDRAELFDAVVGWLSDVAASDPVVLVLEDLHWATPAALLLVRHLVRSLVRAPLLIVGTYRDTDIDRSHPFASTLADLRRELPVDRVLLDGLDPEAVVTLIGSASGAPVDPAGARFAAGLHARTEGNPFFIGQMLRHLTDTGLVRRQDDRWVPERPLESMAVPDGVRDMVGQRLARFRPDVERVLAAGAVLGVTFEFDVLAALVEGGEAAALEAVEAALAARLLQEASDRGRPAYGFVHALVGQVLYDDLSLPRRQRLHRRAAEAIEAVYGSPPGDQLGAVARHLRQAGPTADPELTVRRSEQAAAHAMDQFAYDEAARHWWEAAEVVGDALPEGQRAALYERAGDALRTVDPDLPDAVSYLERALTLYERAGLTESAGIVHSKLGVVLNFNVLRKDIPGAIDHFRTAQRLLGPEHPRVGWVGSTFAHALAHGLQLDDAEGQVVRALDFARRHGDPDGTSLARAELTRGWLLVERGRLAEGLELIAGAARAGDRGGNLTGTYSCYIGGDTLGMLLDPLEAERLVSRQLAEPQLAHVHKLRADLFKLLFDARTRAGRLGDARRMAEDPDLGSPGLGIDEQLETSKIWLGRDPGVLDELAAGLERCLVTGDRWSVLRGGLDLAETYRVLGHHGAARALIARELERAVAHGSVFFELLFAAELAVLLAQDGDTGQAAPLVDRCREIIDAGEDWRGRAGRVLLAAALARGDAASLSAATGVFRRYQLPWDEAEALWRWGQLRREPELLTEARALWQRIGAPPSLRCLSEEGTLPASSSGGG